MAHKECVECESQNVGPDDDVCDDCAHKIYMEEHRWDDEYEDLYKKDIENAKATPGNSSRSYYVVWRGRKPGIYDSWANCVEQTNGYKGTSYKKFLAYEDAYAAYMLRKGGASSSERSLNCQFLSQRIKDLDQLGTSYVKQDIQSTSSELKEK